MKKLKKEEQRKMKLVQCKLKYAPTPYDCNHHLKEKREKEAFFLFFYFIFFFLCVLVVKRVLAPSGPTR